MFNKGIVLVCDTVNERKNVNIFTDNLEFTSKAYFNAMISALKETGRNYTIYYSLEEFIDNIKKHKNDIVFSAIWSGVLSRNRKSLLPSICESYKIQYIGADTYVQTICQDKYLTKLYCKDYNIKIPRGFLFDSLQNIEKIQNLKFPVIVKPNCEGSSIGISDNNICDNFEQAVETLKILLNKFNPVLIEEYIDGQEISVCIVGRDKIEMCEAIALVIDGKKEFKHKIWGYETKKCGVSKVTRECVTKLLPKEMIDECKKIFIEFGKVDYMRIDGRLLDNDFYLIEFTPDCSLHPDCFMANSFYANNLDFNDMISKFISLYD